MKKYNIKRIVGALLTILGSAGIVFAVVLLVITLIGVNYERILVTAGLLSVILFASGIGLVQATRDDG